MPGAARVIRAVIASCSIYNATDFWRRAGEIGDVDTRILSADCRRLPLTRQCPSSRWIDSRAEVRADEQEVAQPTWNPCPDALDCAADNATSRFYFSFLRRLEMGAALSLAWAVSREKSMT